MKVTILDEGIQRYQSQFDISILMRTVSEVAQLSHIIDLLEEIYYNPYLLTQTAKQSHWQGQQRAQLVLHTSEELDYQLCLELWEQDQMENRIST